VQTCALPISSASRKLRGEVKSYPVAARTQAKSGLSPSPTPSSPAFAAGRTLWTSLFAVSPSTVAARAAARRQAAAARCHPAPSCSQRTPDVIPAPIHHPEAAKSPSKTRTAAARTAETRLVRAQDRVKLEPSRCAAGCALKPIDGPPPHGPCIWGPSSRYEGLSGPVITGPPKPYAYRDGETSEERRVGEDG